jgi:hypothetical protein
MRARVGDQVGPRHMNMCLGSSSFRTFSLIFWFSFFRSFFFHFFFGFFFISNSSKFKIQANFIAEHFSNSKHFLYLNFSSMSFFSNMDTFQRNNNRKNEKSAAIPVPGRRKRRDA